jgi:hypothetical protein
MPLQIQTFEARDFEGGNSADGGLAALQLCRTLRGTNGVANATYWLEGGWGQFVVITQIQAGINPVQVFTDPSVAKATQDLSRICRTKTTQLFHDPQTGSDVLEGANS